jgi:hypothetical protein
MLPDHIAREGGLRVRNPVAFGFWRIPGRGTWKSREALTLVWPLLWRSPAGTADCPGTAGPGLRCRAPVNWRMLNHAKRGGRV